MGHIVDMLRERFFGPGVYNKTALLEIQECIHFHYRDLRLVLTKSDFLALCSIFKDAEKKFLDMGQPEQTKDMVSLADTSLGDGIANNRVGAELQIADDVHFHYKDLRIHLNLADFLAVGEVIKSSMLNIPERFVSEVTIASCSYHSVVHKYIGILEGYIQSGVKSSGALTKFRNKLIKQWSAVGAYEQRVFGFPEEYPGAENPEDDKKYLISIYESLNKYGYHPDELDTEYMVAYRTNDGIYLTGAHRIAALKVLGVEKIKVILVAPETNWKED